MLVLFQTLLKMEDKMFLLALSLSITDDNPKLSVQTLPLLLIVTPKPSWLVRLIYKFYKSNIEFGYYSYNVAILLLHKGQMSAKFSSQVSGGAINFLGQIVSHKPALVQSGWPSSSLKCSNVNNEENNVAIQHFYQDVTIRNGIFQYPLQKYNKCIPLILPKIFDLIETFFF